jgi:hypothetical protein
MRRGGGARASASRRVSWPTPQSELQGDRVRRRLVVRGGDLSCEAKTCRARRRLAVRGEDLSCEAETLSGQAKTCRVRQRLVGGIPLVGNRSEMLPTGRKHVILPVWVLTEVLSPPRLGS